MPEAPENLIDQYSVPSEIVKKRADIIIANLTSGIKPVSNPKVVILGGQPGSGKGELTTQALLKITGNSVICNADDYRDLHPQIKEIKDLQPQYYPDLTSKFAQDCNNLLRQYCEENRLNYILETTFSSGERMNDTIREMRNKEYEVSVMLLAVHHNLSFLGTKLRYESMFAQSRFGRTVSKKQHDDRYELIISTLKTVISAKLYQDIYIYGRASRQRLSGTTIGLRELSHNGVDPLTDYITERTKLWSENDLRYFTTDILQLIRLMVQRKASNEELLEVFAVFDIENVETLLTPVPVNE